MIGGSADLTPSTLTQLDCSHDFQAGARTGRYLRFGVREHAMAAICNGIAAYGGLVPFCATFLNFIGYAFGAVRLSAISHRRVLYIMTHDSIGLGEDGPTHQPIESLAMCRAMPNLLTIRPADGNEVSGAYAVALDQPHRPSVIALSRQNVRHVPNTSIEAVYRGAYVVRDCPDPEVVLIGTGAEVGLCYETAEKALSDVRVRVVSMPCMELFEEQPLDYRRSILPDGVPTLSVEAAAVFGWDRYAHSHVGMTSFGHSGPAAAVFKLFGFTPDAVAQKARALIAYYAGSGRPVPSLLARPE